MLGGLGGFLQGRNQRRRSELQEANELLKRQYQEEKIQDDRRYSEFRELEKRRYEEQQKFKHQTMDVSKEDMELYHVLNRNNKVIDSALNAVDQAEKYGVINKTGFGGWLTDQANKIYMNQAQRDAKADLQLVQQLLVQGLIAQEGAHSTDNTIANAKELLDFTNKTPSEIKSILKGMKNFNASTIGDINNRIDASNPNSYREHLQNPEIDEARQEHLQNKIGEKVDKLTDKQLNTAVVQLGGTEEIKNLPDSEKSSWVKNVMHDTLKALTIGTGTIGGGILGIPGGPGGIFWGSVAGGTTAATLFNYVDNLANDVKNPGKAALKDIPAEATSVGVGELVTPVIAKLLKPAISKISDSTVGLAKDAGKFWYNAGRGTAKGVQHELPAAYEAAAAKAGTQKIPRDAVLKSASEHAAENLGITQTEEMKKLINDQLGDNVTPQRLEKFITDLKNSDYKFGKTGFSAENHEALGRHLEEKLLPNRYPVSQVQGNIKSMGEMLAKGDVEAAMMHYKSLPEYIETPNVPTGKLPKESILLDVVSQHSNIFGLKYNNKLDLGKLEGILPTVLNLGKGFIQRLTVQSAKNKEAAKVITEAAYGKLATDVQKKQVQMALRAKVLEEILPTLEVQMQQSVMSGINKFPIKAIGRGLTAVEMRNQLNNWLGKD